MPPESTTYRRTNLYHEVWAEPVRTVAKRYGVSDVALAKMCRRHAIPLPKPGHWARVAAGHFDEPTPLPALPVGGVEEWTVERRPADDLQRGAPGKKSAWRPPKTPPQIRVNAELTDPHTLVASSRGVLSRADPDDDGMLQQSRENCLDLRVSPASFDRALRITDALLKACDARGMRCEIAKVDQRERYTTYRMPPTVMSNVTRLWVNGEWIRLTVREKYLIQHDAPPKPPKNLHGEARESWIRWNRPQPRHVPSGVLELSISCDDQLAAWKGYKRRSLEMLLGDVVERLHVMATAVKAGREEAERRRKQEEAAGREREAAEQRAEKVRQQDEYVRNSLGQWRLAEDLREYAAEVRRIVADADCRLNPDGSMERLVQWAISLADRIDPLEPLRKEVGQIVENRRTMIGPAGEADEQAMRARAEQKLIAELRDHIANWREAQEIRAHVAACASVLDGRDLQFEGGENAAEWMRWAAQHADRIDPMSGWKHAAASGHRL